MSQLEYQTSFSQLDDEAVKWLVQLDRIEPLVEIGFNIDELAKRNPLFADWVEQSFAHRVAFLRVWHGWSKVDLLQDSAQDIDQACVAIEQNDRPAAQPIYAWAASIFAAIAIAMSSHIYLSSDQPTSNHVKTELGQTKLVKLQDGSAVQMNSNTIIEPAINDTERLVTLKQGEAFFDISHDKSRPFRVVTGTQVITVLGTKFSVHKQGDEIEIVVESGKVQVDHWAASDQSTTAILGAGDIARSNQQDIAIHAAKEETVSRELSWRQGLITFDGVSLRQAAKEFERYNPIRIEIPNSQTAQVKISGQFNNTSYQAFLRLLDIGYSLKVTKVAGQSTYIIQEPPTSLTNN